MPNLRNKIEKKLKNTNKYFTKQKVKNILFGATTGRRIFRIYFLLIFIAAILLYLPFSFQNFLDSGFSESFKYVSNHYIITLSNGDVIKINFFDTLFMSVSSFSDTGLTLFSINEVYSVFGKIMLMITIQIGGFGIMFFIFIFWKLVRKVDKISLNQALMAQSEKGNTKIGSNEKMIITSSLIIIIIEILFAFFYSVWFLCVPSYEQILYTGGANGLLPEPLPIYYDNPNGIFTSVYQNPSEAFFAGFFHSVSVVNNAGLDIMGDYSLSAFRNGIHTLFLFVTMFQFILGGIGFPIIFDIFSKWKLVKRSKIIKINDKNIKKWYWRISILKSHKLSLFSKLTLWSYFIIAILGILFIFMFEALPTSSNNIIWENGIMFGPNNETLTWYNKSVNLIFQSITTRSAGYATFNNFLLNTSTKWLNISLMFIGGSASSTAGGIRVTTLAIIVIAIYHKLRGSKRVSVFKRNLDNDVIMNSFIVFTFSIFMISIGGVIIINDITGVYDFHSRLNNYFTDAIFISSSAFGTTGLSTVDIYELKWWSKLYLMFLMFVGQYGVSSTILAFKRKKIKENLFNYPTEPVRIG